MVAGEKGMVTEAFTEWFYDLIKRFKSRPQREWSYERS